jgi:hypothetical protein
MICRLATKLPNDSSGPFPRAMKEHHQTKKTVPASRLPISRRDAGMLSARNPAAPLL